MTTPISALSSFLPASFLPAATTTGTSGTSATTGTSSTSGTGSTPSSASSSSLLDPQAFLQLLVAQLQYQDPSNPVDTSSFMNQTAMLSQVQTMTSMSSTLNSLVSAQQAQAATSMIGKTISYVDGTTGGTQTGIVTGAELGTTGAAVKVGSIQVPLTSIREVTGS